MRIKRRKRLIEHKNPRPRRKHTSKRHALLLPTRKLHGIALLHPQKAKTLHLLTNRLCTLGRGDALRQARRHVLLNGQIRKQHVILKQQRRLSLLGRKVDLGLFAERLVEKHRVVHYDFARIGLFDSCNRSHRERLTAPRCAQKAKRFIAGRKLLA